MIDVSNSEREIRVSVLSDLDDASLPPFESLLAKLIAGDPRPITVDLTQCPYISSSVITLLIKARQSAPEPFEVLIARQGVVNKIFYVCGFIERKFLVTLA